MAANRASSFATTSANGSAAPYRVTTGSGSHCPM